MPRPRVRPEDRRRSARACVPCKLSKKRCDAQLPCASCLRRDRALSCVYRDDPKSRARSALSHASAPRRSRDRSEEVSPVQLRAEVDVASRERNLSLERTPDIPTSPGNTLSLENRVLISSKGEKVYCGKLASLSFLQFLRRTLKQQMGPSPFTESERRHSMLEADVTAHKPGGFTEPLSEKKALTQVYFEATGALIDLFTRNEINRLLVESEKLPTGIPSSAKNRDDLAALYVAVAIGGQCRGSSPEDLHLATKYFAEAQKFAFEGMLRDPSLSMVRLFLLMAFYMLGACHRNAAFMYLGVASKAAEALGLHTPEYHRSVRDESDLSIRTWKSLRILDLLVSAILGRHSSLSAVRYDSAIPGDTSTSQGRRNHRSLAIDATFEACSILDEITQKLGKSENLDATTSQSLLQKLQQWSQNLPNELRQFARTENSTLMSSDKELLIENMHVACVYYFSVILVTRPFLISHLMLRLHNRTSDSLDSNAEAASHQQMLELAHACVSSASYLIQMSHRALTLGLLLKNMCILKAWIFAAGLVLGFSLFPREEARHDIEDAFTKARHILEVLAELSPQAKHYHEILSNFSEAIARYQQRIAYERQGTGSQYVSQILSIEVDHGGDGGGGGPGNAPSSHWRGVPEAAPRFPQTGHNGTLSVAPGDNCALGGTPATIAIQQQQQPGRPDESPSTAQQIPDEPFPDAQLLWDDSSNQLLGSFPLDYETFGMLFEGVGGLTSDLSL